MRRLHRAMDQLFPRIASWPSPLGESSPALSSWNPSFDVKENDSHITVRADLPGVNKDDIHVNVENGMLTVRGSRSSETKTEKDNFHVCEREYGSFSRSISLPSGIDVSAIEASHDNGVLELSIPKPAPQSDVTRISIKSREPAITSSSSSSSSTSSSS